MKYNMAMIKKRLAQLRAMSRTEVPIEVLNQVDRQNMLNVLNGVWGDHIKDRPFSPLVKQLLTNDDRVPLSSPFTHGERGYLKAVANNLFKTYGEPIFSYSGKYDDTADEIPRVKAWQNFLKIGPKVTAGANSRRFENFSKYLRKQIFNPRIEILNQAIDVFLHVCNLKPVVLDFTPQAVKGLFAAHDSNVGYPFFRNERSKIHGKIVRDYTVEITKQLNAKYGSQWMCSIPSIIIGRDQAGGLDVDRKPTSMEELTTMIDNVNYKPSKARVVWAVDRLSNNNINVILKAIITSQQFKENPYFCGFRSREERHPLYYKFDKFVRANKLVPINVDYASFDTTLSPELLMIALDIIFSWVDLRGAPVGIQDSVTSKTIYTKYILMDPETHKLLMGTKEGSIPSGIGVTGLAGFICAQLSWWYAVIAYYGAQVAWDWANQARSAGTFPMTGLGDDLLAVVKSFDDLRPIAKIIQETFGMEISVDTVKTAVGVDFLQELFWDGRIMYPSARVAESALYTERKKGLGWAEWDMAFFSMLWNVRTNPHDDLLGIASIIQNLDATKLGLITPEGSNMTLEAFRDELRKELAEHEVTAKQLLWDGDPAKENKFDVQGAFKSDYLQWTRKLALSANNYGGPGLRVTNSLKVKERDHEQNR